jgi:hypothetical protein
MTAEIASDTYPAIEIGLYRSIPAIEIGVNLKRSRRTRSRSEGIVA